MVTVSFERIEKHAIRSGCVDEIIMSEHTFRSYGPWTLNGYDWSF